jgi:ABC-type nitrate/sulfonate/bicarbonate transport system permease component
MVALVSVLIWAFPHNDSGRRRTAVPAFLLFDAGRCRRPHREMVFRRNDLAASVDTLAEAMLAFVLGSLGGVLVGFWFARQPRVADVFDPYVKAVNALPRIVLAPIFTLWFGLGIWSKVALGVTLRVLHRVLQRVPGREGSEPDRAGQCPHARL